MLLARELGGGPRAEESERVDQVIKEGYSVTSSNGPTLMEPDIPRQLLQLLSRRTCQAVAVQPQILQLRELSYLGGYVA